MLQKLNEQQMLKMAQSELNKHREEVAAYKEELAELKKKNAKTWNAKQQAELEDAALYLADIDSAVEQKLEKAYKPKPGTEKMVHLLIVKGRRFNPMTGKEISPAYPQLFTYSEWQLFKKTHKGLGFTIMEVLYDPYGEAEAYVQKNKE